MSKKISKETVEYVAKLARIELLDDEVQKYSTELSSIVDYVDQVQSVETDGLEPTYHPARFENQDVLENITREDRVKQYSDREALLDAAPEREGDYIKVKSVLT
ncbi:Asp-tRNA(Asn)/Glu-tRNA(Gln) amidotransferase subunit GatC [Patescibacteria group bacterium]|nr:Asp-tRNA(Asn)/Glu-tRNA(Gln) amidotransferase subunit GatC [Patescibacteria group bacterium]